MKVPVTEIGGYIQLDRYSLPMPYQNEIALNCGRNCLKWIVEKKHITKLLMPRFLCDTAWEACGDVSIRFYSIGEDFLPLGLDPDTDEWIYLVNYYGQLDPSVIDDYICRYGKVIVDNTQGYFDKPVEGAYTIYSCRKYFGVPDGAFLVCQDSELRKGYEDLPISSSSDHMHFLLGRLEHGANPYYSEYVENNKRFHNAPVERMSALTENLLHGIDYDFVKQRRSDNYQYLVSRLKEKNRLVLHDSQGAFSYPLWIKNGAEIREKMIRQKIYIPLLWPNVVSAMPESSLEYDLALNILPLPCDQRYGIEEMEIICKTLDL